MEVEDVIKKVVNLNFGEEDLDNACLLRIEKLARDKGKDGIVILSLLRIIRDALEIK